MAQQIVCLLWYGPKLLWSDDQELNYSGMNFLLNLNFDGKIINEISLDNKVHGANMGPTWVLSTPDGPHVGPMNLAIRVPQDHNNVITIHETWVTSNYLNFNYNLNCTEIKIWQLSPLNDTFCELNGFNKANLMIVTTMTHISNQMELISWGLSKVALILNTSK